MKVALIAVFAFFFVFAGANGHGQTKFQPQAFAHHHGPAPLPVESSGEAPHLADPGLARLDKHQGRIRQAPPRKLSAVRKLARTSAGQPHDAALNGAAFALAIAARDRERQEPPARRACQLTSRLVARGPPLLV